MASFPAWDRTVLEQCYEDVDYLALHQYYPADVVDEQSFLVSGHDLDDYVRAAIATCDYVRAHKRSRRTDVALPWTSGTSTTATTHKLPSPGPPGPGSVSTITPPEMRLSRRTSS